MARLVPSISCVIPDVDTSLDISVPGTADLIGLGLDARASSSTVQSVDHQIKQKRGHSFRNLQGRPLTTNSCFLLMITKYVTSAPNNHALSPSPNPLIPLLRMRYPNTFPFSLLHHLPHSRPPQQPNRHPNKCQHNNLVLPTIPLETCSEDILLLCVLTYR